MSQVKFLKIDLILKKNLPKKVLYLLNYLFSRDENFYDDDFYFNNKKLFPKHHFFLTPRWKDISPLPESDSLFTFLKPGFHLKLDISIRSYNHEIDRFLSLISPYVMAMRNSSYFIEDDDSSYKIIFIDEVLQICKKQSFDIEVIQLGSEIISVDAFNLEEAEELALLEIENSPEDYFNYAECSHVLLNESHSQIVDNIWEVKFTYKMEN